MSVTVKVGAAEFELYYNTLAMKKIASICGGDIEKLGAWLDKGTLTEKVEKNSKLLAILINGGFQKKNFDIECGLCKGPKHVLFEESFFENAINPNDFGKYQTAIFNAMSRGSEFVIPDNVMLTMQKSEDPDLKAIREANEKEKN